MAPSDPDNPIRKAAILFRSLEPEAAAVMLGRLSQSEARVLRDAVRSLSGVTDDERLGVAEEVRTHAPSAESATTSVAADGVELEISGPSAPRHDYEAPAPIAEPDHANPTPDSGQRPDPFAALPQIENADAATLAAYLERENPAVVAVVLSYLPPERAAAVLEQLAFGLRAEAIERLADLGEGDPDALHVLAADLSAWIARRQEEQTRRANRLATINAIVGAAGPESGDALIDQLKQRGCGWVDGLAAMSPSDATPLVDAAEEPAAEAADELSGSRDDSDSESTEAIEPAPGVETLAARPRSVPFDAVAELPPRMLAEVMKRTPPRQVLLAVAGATESLQRRIESLLTGKQARELRRRLEILGPTRLSEVDDAQESMSAIASDLWDVVHGRRAA